MNQKNDNTYKIVNKIKNLQTPEEKNSNVNYSYNINYGNNVNNNQKYSNCLHSEKEKESIKKFNFLNLANEIEELNFIYENNPIKNKFGNRKSKDNEDPINILIYYLDCSSLFKWFNVYNFRTRSSPA